MAVTSKRKPADTAAADVEAMITTLARVVNRLAVSNARGPGSFRAVMTTQLRIASDAEVDQIEAWLKAHQ